MDLEATYSVGGNQRFTTGSPHDLMAYLQQIPSNYTVDDLMDASAGDTPSDPHSSGGTSHPTASPDIMSMAMEVAAAAWQRQPVLQHHVPLARPTIPTGAEEIPHHQHSAHTESGWPCPGININPGGLSQIPIQIQIQPQLPPCSVVGDPGPSTGTGTGTEEMRESGTLAAALFQFRRPVPQLQEVNAIHTHTPSAAAATAVDDVPPVVNATGDSSRCASTATPDAAGNSSPDLELDVNATAGLHQSASGGGASFTVTEEAPERRGSGKRKKVGGAVSGSTSQRSTPEFNMSESLAGFVQSHSDPSYSDIKPPTGSTEIIDFLEKECDKLTRWKEVNLSLAEQDQTAPKAVRSYVTTTRMMPEQHKTHRGIWMEKEVISVLFGGLKRTLQFLKSDGTKTNWFMHEHILTALWGSDLYMKDLYFREVFIGDGEVAGDETTPPNVKGKNKIAAAVKHRMRGPSDMVIKGESPVWKDFIKIYDMHPQLEGSKVVYAVCCNCDSVLKAGTKNGTSSLSTHCNRTCPKQQQQQQPSSR